MRPQIASLGGVGMNAPTSHSGPSDPSPAVDGSGMPTLTTIRTALDTAITCWTGLDWGVTETGDELEILTVRVEADTERAADAGMATLAALAAGDHDTAIRQAELASGIEREYGDDPAWGPFLAVVRAYVAARMVPAMARYQVLTACAAMPNSCRGHYRRVALVECDTDVLSAAGLLRPAIITDRAVGVVEIVQTWERRFAGSTEGCGYMRALRAAETEATVRNLAWYTAHPDQLEADHARSEAVS